MMSPSYHVFHVHPPDDLLEVVQAWLSELPFNGLLETEEGLEAYLSPEGDVDAVRAALRERLSPLGVTWRESELASRNWNELWESSFPPIRIGKFAGVRAEFHAPLEDVEHELVIQPRMAFGTGHHATTYLMMEWMGELPIAGSRIFDFGCGTGILAILALRLGAIEVHAVDIEREAYENTLDNAQRNEVNGLHVYCGELAAVPKSLSYDIILANINRNVILASLASLYQRLSGDGRLLVSGILVADGPDVVAAAREVGFMFIGERSQQGWLAIHFQRPL